MSDETKKELPFVIGAGFGRTGTHSLKAALLNLGYSKVFHMRDVFQDSSTWFHLAKMERAMGAKHPELAMKTAQYVIDQGYMATTDHPTCLLYPEFMKLRPDGKVILSVRSNSSEWKKSVMETIGLLVQTMFKPPFSFLPFCQNFAGIFSPWMWERSGLAPVGSMKFPQESLDDYDLELLYNNWLDTVKATVPSDRLLVHQSMDGYGPICDFLDIPRKACPEIYPHIGDTNEMKARHRLMETIALLFWPVVGLLLAITIWVVKKTMMRSGPQAKNKLQGKED